MQKDEEKPSFFAGIGNMVSDGFEVNIFKINSNLITLFDELLLKIFS